MKILLCQPISEKNPQLCGVDWLQILSRYKNGDWEIVFDKELSPRTFLSRDKFIVIPMPLSIEEKICQYQVVLHYVAIGEVRSPEVFEWRVDPIGVCHVANYKIKFSLKMVLHHNYL